MVGIEIDRGLLIVTALVGAGYLVYAVNPMATSRYRDRHATSGAKSDPGDAKILADLVSTDRHNHREVAGDTELVEGIKMLARAHQNAIWARQRQVNALRSSLREYYPGALAAFGTDLSNTDACLGALDRADSGELDASCRARRSLRLCAGRSVAAISTRRPKRSRPHSVPTISKLLAGIAEAHGSMARSSRTSSSIYDSDRRASRAALAEHFEQHPDAKIVRSLPGLGTVLGARVLGEFGDDRTRYASAKSRKNYAGTSPITKASGQSHVVLARFARNRRLADALDQWAFCSLTSPQEPGTTTTSSEHGARPTDRRLDSCQPLGRHPPRLP